MIEKITWFLRENVVSTDNLEITPECDMKPNGIKYTLHYFTYSTCWTDTEHIKKFKTLEALRRFYGGYLNRGDVINDYDILSAELQ